MAFRQIPRRHCRRPRWDRTNWSPSWDHSGTIAIVWRADPQWSVAYVSENVDRYGY